jgi:uncharacterized membrane protein
MFCLFKKLFFLFIYLAGDLFYVVYSNPIYQQSVFAIAHHDMPGAMRPYAILGAYGCMALGWLIFAVPTADRWSGYFYRPIAGLLAGMTYGITLIGTFNFTLNLMFEGWAGAIVTRDLTWGICWSAVSVCLYTIFCKKHTERSLYHHAHTKNTIL